MAKCPTFSPSISSVRGYVRAQTSLMTILGLVLGMFICTSPAYAQSPADAQSPITVKFMSLGQAKSAAILFSGQQLSNCVTTSNSKITGKVDGGGNFFVNFYYTPDCTGTSEKAFPFWVPQGEKGTVTCQASNTKSDVDCQLKFKNVSSSPSLPPSLPPFSPSLSPLPPSVQMTMVIFEDLGDSLSGGIINGGRQVGDCVTTNQTTLSVPLDNYDEFSVTLFSTSDCTGTIKKTFRFSLLERQSVVTCHGDDAKALSGAKLLPS